MVRSDMPPDEYRVGDISQEEIDEDFDSAPAGMIQEAIYWPGVGSLRRRMARDEGPDVDIADRPVFDGRWTGFIDDGHIEAVQDLDERDEAGAAYRLLTETGTVSAGDIGAEILQAAGVQEPDASTDYQAVADRFNVDVDTLPFINDGVVDPGRIGNWQGQTTAAARRKRRRSEAREEAKSIAEEAGLSLEEYAIDATADGVVTIQDRDTNRTRTIDPDSGESGIDSAVESLDSSSDSSTSDSDSTGGEQDSSPGGESEGLGQIGGTMLVAAIATAVYYGVTQT